VGSITIKDVAKYAGVSIATVSRVVNQNYYVSPEVEEKVNEAIKKLNYYPNSIARSLKNESTLTIGLLVSDISNNYFTTIAKAIEDVVCQERYNIIMCSTENSQEKELTYIKLLMSKKVDGLIINTTGKNNKFIAGLSKSIPMVLINRRIEDSEFVGDFIDTNNLEGVYDLTNHLLSTGHRKIGIINGDLEVSTGYERFDGFKQAMLKVGVIVDDKYPFRYDGDFTVESGYQGALKLLSQSDKPTALISMNNSMTIGVLKYMRLKNIKEPEDIALASYGALDNMELMYVKPSIIALNEWVLGRKAGEFILQRIKNESLSNREAIYTPQLIPGNDVIIV
jgi:DNA-binding LacI/PurR family transcriptional regulator